MFKMSSFKENITKQQTDSKVYMERKRPKIVNIILKQKNKVGGFTLSNIKIYYKAA